MEIEFETKVLLSIKTTGLKRRWRRPTLPLLRSTIGATRLNFSVRKWEEVDPLCNNHLNKSSAHNRFDSCYNRYSIDYKL